MSRTPLTDGSGRWFDRDKAESFEEDAVWDGSNHISQATHTQWDHQKLYRTASGLYVLHSWSQWQNSVDTWVMISREAAAIWLVQNGHDEPAELAPEVAALEIR